MTTPEFFEQDNLPIESRSVTDESPKIELDRQYSFAYVVKPEFWGVEPRQLKSEDYRDMALMTPDVLLSRLVTSNGTSAGPSSRYYYDDNRRRVNVALTPTEFGIVIGSPQQLGQRAVNQTMGRRSNLLENLDASRDAAKRSGGHALGTYINKMDQYTTNVLEKDLEKLKSFQEYASNPQLQRLRGDNFRINMEWLRGHIFGDMFAALGSQRNWGQEQENRAKKALDSRLFLDREDNNHIKNWQGMLDFEITYTGYKWALFKTKLADARHYKEKNHGKPHLR